MSINNTKSLFEGCHDIIMREEMYEDNSKIELIYCRSLCQEQLINEMILPQLLKIYNESQFNRIDAFTMNKSVLIIEVTSEEKIIDAVFTGYVLIHIAKLNTNFITCIEHIPNRTTEETNIDVSIRGPKDGFTESIEINIGLIRKRLPTSSLHYYDYQIGTISKTKVGLMYFNGKANSNIINDIQNRLSQIQDKIETLSTGAELEELISDNPNSIFPLTVYTGRADFIVSYLLKGRFVILINGIPGALIAPANLTLLLKTPEDSHFNYISSSFGRILRVFSLVISIFLLKNLQT